MKKAFFLLSCIVLGTSINMNINAQNNTGKVLEGLSMNSDILNNNVNYSIYLPHDYDYSQRHYPVVYLLHGYSDDETAWVQFGEVNLTADRAIESREIPPMIIVMPDAKITWYINDHLGKERYEDMFFEEFIPYIEKQYRIRSKKEFRAVSGLSMGGYGSLIYALHHPDMFAACAPFSAGIHTNDEIINMTEERYNQWYARLYGENKKGKDRLTEHWHKNSVLACMKNMPEENKNKVRFYIDCGDDDFLYEGNSELHILMRDLNIPHEYRVRDGEHNWTYWRTGIKNALIFIGKSFHR